MRFVNGYGYGMILHKVLTALGRAFISAGVLIFLFIAYQLWGTGLAEANSQSALRSQAAGLFAQADKPTSTTTPAKSDKSGTTSTTNPGTSVPTTTQPPNTTPAPPPAPAGSAVAVIKIPKIGLEKAVVEGTGVDDLKKGPGHYLNTPLPGQPGNAAIAGHRTTYGAPFGDLAELSNGDEIDVTTRQGSFRYRVTAQQVVEPTDVSVLNPTNDNRLTLTTCHPKFSASHRLVVTAMLDDRPAPAAPLTTATPTPAPANPSTPPTTGSATTSAKTGTHPAAAAPATSVDLQGADLSGTATSKWPAVIWGLLAAITAGAIYLIGWLWRPWPAYLLGVLPFLVVLFVFFENFSRLLPANA